MEGSHGEPETRNSKGICTMAATSFKQIIDGLHSLELTAKESKSGTCNWLEQRARKEGGEKKFRGNEQHCHRR